jgi:hypothetical protein
MPYQHFDIYICRKPKFGTLEELWPQVKRGARSEGREQSN